jgi:hypothetical protein
MPTQWVKWWAALALAVVAAMQVAMAPVAIAQDAAEALKRRNPYLAELADQDPETFSKAAALIAEIERKHDLAPERKAPPPTTATGRDMGESFFGQKMLPQNPDILWLYNSSPEGMHDLIALLKSAGSKPKP